MSTPWPTTSIGELFDIGAGKSVTPASRGQEPKRPFLRTSNVLWGRFDLTDVDTMFFTDDEFAVKDLRSGDLLVCEGGDIGRAAVWQGQLDECSFQNHLHRLRPKRPDISPEFYQFALEGGITLFGLIEGVGNRTTIPNLSRNRLADLAVPLPPIDEQRKIAAVLGKVQAAVAVEGDLVRVARELKQAALRQLFTRGLRHEPQKQTTLGPVPESWDVVPVAECVMPFRFDRKQQVPAAAYSETGRFPIVDQGKQAIAGYCDDETKVITPRPALIVFGDHTRCMKFVDFPFVLGSDGTKPLVAKPEWDARTLFYALSSVDVESHGYNRHYKYLSEKWVARSPDPAEQREIAALLATLDAKIAHHEARQALLRELFRTLLHDLLTARRRVTSLDLSEDFSASNLTENKKPGLG